MAGKYIRKFAKWFFLSINIICCIFFLLGCLSLYFSPAQWSPIGFLSIGLPYVAVVLILYIIFWLIAKPRLAVLPLITLLIGWKQLGVIIAWHPSATFSELKKDSTFRILTWNVRGMYGISNSYYTQQRNRTDIATLINKMDADIICLQEFNNISLKGDPNYNNIGLFTNNYPYHFFSEDFTNKAGYYTSGTILYSKHKILDAKKIKFKGENAESLIYADILLNDDTIRIFTTHLQSFEFTREDYQNIEKIKKTDDKALEASESIYSKMKAAFTLRSAQADIVRNELDKCTQPSVICGDFNDVPNSYTYFHIRGDRQDAFLSRSFGIGKSFNALAPTLRIDYILPDKNFVIKQFEMVDEGLSDHHLLVTDLNLKK
jgi:endonuclease/exonuclease/phosphatase family metal-dependent hydrolase